jgi:hypothetical protein
MPVTQREKGAGDVGTCGKGGKAIAWKASYGLFSPY